MNRNLQLGVVMDPIAAIQPHKDTSLALLLAAQQRGWDLHYMERRDLSLTPQAVGARMRALEVCDDPHRWFSLQEAAEWRPLDCLDAVLVRLDPPFDMSYIYATQLLQRACLLYPRLSVINDPGSLQRFNEKLCATLFEQWCPATLVSSDPEQLRDFLNENGEIVIKPLGAMGGYSIFRLRRDDWNISVVLELMLAAGEPIMAQAFVPEIAAGDKRVFVVGAEPMPWMLVRVPAPGETRGNLVAGASGEVQPVGETELAISRSVGAELHKHGVLLAGLDVIGDRLTEVNITSPTGMREIERSSGFSIAERALDCVAAEVGAKNPELQPPGR